MGKDCQKWSTHELKSIIYELNYIFNTPKQMKKITKQEIDFQSATCHICEKPFLPPQIRTLDYSLLTGKYRDCSHKSSP